MDESVGKIASATGKVADASRALIEKFSIGRLYDPTNVRRMADAESYARIQQAKTEREVALYKAETRLLQEQTNIDAHVQLAAAMLTENAKPEKMSPDVVNMIKEKVKIAEDSDMRVLWAKLIAGEAESPGSFSKRVIEEVAQLSKGEAQAFTTFAGYVWTSKQTGPVIATKVGFLSSDEADSMAVRSWFLNPDNPLYNTNLTSGISIDTISYFPQESNIGKVLHMSYYGRRCTIRLKKTDITFTDGPHLTHIGRALLPICGGAPIQGEYERVVERWKKDDQFDVVSHV